MNPASPKSKKKGKRRRISTSLSPNNSTSKAAKNVLELSHELSGLIERLGDGSHYENELEKSRAVPGDPIISSSQLSNSSKRFFKQKPCKSMTKRRTFTKIAEFESEQECDYHIRSTHPHTVVTTHNDIVRCTLCVNNDKHKMSSKYLKCKCGLKDCSFGYRINKCINDNIWVLSQGGFHPELIEEIEDDEGITVKPVHRKHKKKYGLALRIKLLINGKNLKKISSLNFSYWMFFLLKEWLEHDDIITPKRLLSKIINRRKKESIKSKQERNPKYDFSKQIIPSLKQVTN